MSCSKLQFLFDLQERYNRSDKKIIEKKLKVYPKIVREDIQAMNLIKFHAMKQK